MENFTDPSYSARFDFRDTCTADVPASSRCSPVFAFEFVYMNHEITVPYFPSLRSYSSRFHCRPPCFAGDIQPTIYESIGRNGSRYDRDVCHRRLMNDQGGKSDQRYSSSIGRCNFEVTRWCIDAWDVEVKFVPSFICASLSVSNRRTSSSSGGELSSVNV